MLDAISGTDSSRSNLTIISACSGVSPCFLKRTVLYRSPSVSHISLRIFSSKGMLLFLRSVTSFNDSLRILPTLYSSDSRSPQTGHDIGIPSFTLSSQRIPHFLQMIASVSLFHLLLPQDGHFEGFFFVSQIYPHLKHLTFLASSQSHSVDLHNGHILGFSSFPPVFQTYPQSLHWLIGLLSVLSQL